MTKQLGPTFGDEVIAAGLGGLPFAWGPDGTITGRDDLDAGQKATLDQVIAAHDPTKKLIESVTKLQAMIALQRTGKLAAVEAAVASNPENKIWYDHSQIWDRNNPRIIGLAPAVGLSPKDLDDLFALAKTIIV